MKKVFTFYAEGQVIDWIETLPAGKKSQSINAAITSYLGSQESDEVKFKAKIRARALEIVGKTHGDLVALAIMEAIGETE